MSAPVTGRPCSFRAFHNTDTGDIKYGSGGAFFAPEPTLDYGGQTLEVSLHFKNPLVVGDRVDAARIVAPSSARKIEATIVDDLPFASDPQAVYHKLDTMLAKAARKQGFDGIVYTDPASLSSQEYVALTRRGWRSR